MAVSSCLRSGSRGAEARAKAGLKRRISLHRGVYGRPKVVHALQVALVAAVEMVQHGVRGGKGLHDLDHMRVQRRVQHLWGRRVFGVGQRDRQREKFSSA